MILSSCGCKVSWALRGGRGGYAASADASAGFAVCGVDTNRKNRRGQQLICRRLLRIIFCPHPSQTLRIFRWGRGCNASPFQSESCQIGDFHFRNDSDDCNGDFGGIVLTVATVALRFNLFYRLAAHVCRSVWLCFRSGCCIRLPVCRI